MSKIIDFSIRNWDYIFWVVTTYQEQAATRCQQFTIDNERYKVALFFTFILPMNSDVYPLKHFIGYLAAAFNLANIRLTDAKALCKLFLRNPCLDTC